MDDRLQNLCDLYISDLREGAGLHDYDGQIQDLSPSGVKSALARIGGAPGRHRTSPSSTEPLADAHDEAHLFEKAAQVYFGDLEQHRSNPLLHIGNLDLAGYDRKYAPAAQREDAKRAHLAQWPDGVEMAIESLDRVPAPVAAALLAAAKGLAAGIDGIGASADVVAAATAAHDRLVAHLVGFAADGSPDISLGAPALAALMGSIEATTVDIDKLTDQVESERARLTEILRENCGRIEPGVDPREVITRLLADHPDADGVISEAQAQVDEVIAFTRDKGLMPYNDGECIVAPAPESRRWATAMMAWAAPEEPDAPSYYWVTPPELSWPADKIEDWLQIFSRTTLPLITLHEVSPGHFAHGRVLRRAPSLVRRILVSPAFVEGWAHYVEELAVDLGFRAGDARVPVGMAIEALVRVTRLAAALGVHTGSMTVEDAAARFESDAFMTPPGALAEARRATFDPTYGRYTWGKLVIRDTRDKARAAWGSGYTDARFHAALLSLGSPPIGLLETAVERG
jgi:hypothetical protein